MNRSTLALLPPLALAFLLTRALACSSDSATDALDAQAPNDATGDWAADQVAPPGDATSGDGAADAPSDGTRDAASDARPRPAFCNLPGSIQFTAAGRVVLRGGTSPDLGFLKLPTGFCLHYSATPATLSSSGPPLGRDTRSWRSTATSVATSARAWSRCRSTRRAT